MSRSEWVVMRAVWHATEAEAETAVSEVLPWIDKVRKWHVSTVKTMMERLVKKGYLSSRIRGKTCFYRPLVTRNRAARRSVGEMLDTVLDGAFRYATSMLLALGITPQSIIVFSNRTRFENYDECSG